jgi:hypothetical protein
MKNITKIIVGMILATGLMVGLTCCGGIGGGPSSTATGVASLSWSPPTTNSDGTPLTNLAGYKVYYGNSSGQYSKSIDAGNTSSITINNLPVGGTTYFTVTAYDSSGNESSFSNETSKTL